MKFSKKWLVRPDFRDLGTTLVECSLEILDKVTNHVIVASWRRVGLVPWNEEIILRHARESSSMVPTEAPTSHQLVVASIQPLIEGLIDPTHGAAKTTRVKIVPTINTIFSGEEVLDLSEINKKKVIEKKETKLRIATDKENAKVESAEARRVRNNDFSCRGTLHADEKIPVWISSNQWIWCEKCNKFGLCPKCKTINSDLMASHEHSCRGR